MARKPRSDSKLDALPAVAKADLKLWLVEENRKYPDVVELLEKNHKIKTSVGALSNYFSKKLAVERIRMAREACESIGKENTGNDPFVREALFTLRERFFNAAASGSMPIKELRILASIIAADQAGQLKKKELELAERRVAVMERKVEAYDRLKGLAESQLSTEEIIRKQRELFQAV